VLENFSTRVMPGLGLGHDVLHAVNPRLIYASVSGFGMSGPYSGYVATGPSAEPMTGLTALMGYGPDEPRATSKGVLDPMAGTLAASAILAALHRRDATGEGSLVELSLQECGIAYLGEHFVTRQTEGREPDRLANADPHRAPWGVYRCAGEDDWIAITCRDDADWQALCTVAAQGWQDDPRFADVTQRCAHRADLDAAVESWTIGRAPDDLAEELQSAGVPAAPVMQAPQWMTDPQLVARDYFVDLDEPDAGPKRYDGLPLVLDGERPTPSWRAAPMLGEHNAEVLTTVARLGDDDVAALVTAGVVTDRPPAARAPVEA
jgi:crotonobetainyl-CoA:carnitine CoA-transferase CaiB-like acyl-CoA transferase